MHVLLRGIAIVFWMASIECVYAAEPPKESASELKRGAATRFFEKYGELLTTYRRDLAAAIGKSDRIEIVLLSFDGLKERKSELPNDETFPVRPYAAETKILQKRALSRAEREELLPLLKSTIVAPQTGGGAFCHFPIHGLRVFDGEQMIFESTFCYECKNFWVEYPSESFWVGLESRGFEKLMTKLMPIPESEAKRFRDSLGEQK